MVAYARSVADMRCYEIELYSDAVVAHVLCELWVDSWGRLGILDLLGPSLVLLYD